MGMPTQQHRWHSMAGAGRKRGEVGAEGAEEGAEGEGLGRGSGKGGGSAVSMPT